jgi:hypothetical protein
MSKRYIVTHIDEGGAIILDDDAAPEEVFPTIVADALASDILSEYDQETREAAVEMVARLHGLEQPPFPRSTEVYRRRYRIEELPDPELAHEEGPPWLVDIHGNRVDDNFSAFRVALPRSNLRFEIWPNESQHRGRPHCRVSCGSKSATFSIPEGELLVGDIHPNEWEASRTIQQYSEQLLEVWHRMRPDDQKL